MNIKQFIRTVYSNCNTLNVFRGTGICLSCEHSALSDLAPNHEELLSVEAPDKRILDYATWVRGPCFNQIERC